MPGAAVVRVTIIRAIDPRFGVSTHREQQLADHETTGRQGNMESGSSSTTLVRCGDWRVVGPGCTGVRVMGLITRMGRHYNIPALQPAHRVHTLDS